ncbi:3-keto-5-aminohexanoate cleavage protein [Chloroflexota bacterium]
MSEERIARKVIITSAITGAVHFPSMSDYLPLTPKQIADDAIRSYEAGASIVHIHARNPENGMPTPDLNIFREILTDIKSRCDVVVCITTGGAGTIDERIAVVPEFKPELATLNCGSISGGSGKRMLERMKNFKYDWEKMALDREDMVFTNTFAMLRQYSQLDRENGTKPECEIWDTGQANAVKWLIDEGMIDTPVHIQYVMGALSGIPATPGSLVYIHDHCQKLFGEHTWSVAIAGRDQIPMAAVSLAMGGQVRVGLEDNLYAGYGRLAQSSADQVERVVTIAKQMSIAPAAPEEARQMIGLKGLDKVNF